MLTKLDLSVEKLLLKNVRVLDVEKGELGEPCNVLFEQGLIKDLNAPDRVTDCPEMDFNGLTLSPGLIDCHVHILSPYLTEQKGMPGMWTLKQMNRNAELTLAAGIVCVRDMLAPIKIMNNFKEKIDSGKIPGPDIVASGGIFSCQGGYPEAMNPLPSVLGAAVGQPKYQPETEEEVETLVRYLHENNAGVIKVGYTSFSRKLVDGRRLPVIRDNVLDRLCETAHECGLKVSVHHNWSEDMNHLLGFDIDTLEHGVYDRNLTQDEIESVKRNGVEIVPTLTINDSQARFEEKMGFLESERALDYFEPQALEHLKWVCSTWTAFSGESYDGSFGFTRANRGCFDTEIRNTKKLFQSGVKMYAGTDCGAVVAYPGELIDELARLEDIGMTKAEAIRAATADAAELVGKPQLGTLAPGKKASVTIIEGNPLEDLAAYKKVRYVAKDGCFYKTAYDELPDFWPGHEVLFRY